MAAGAHPSIRATLTQVGRPVWLLLVGMLVNRLGSFLQIYLILYLTNRGFAATAAGVALGAYGVGSVIGVMAGGSVSDRLGYRLTIVGSMAAGGVLTVSIVYLDHLPAIILVAGMVGAAMQAYRPASSALLVDITPREQHVMVFAVYRLAFNLGTTAGPLLGALLITYSYEAMFFADAVTSVTFALLALSLPRGRATADASADGEGRGRSYAAVLADRRYLLFMLALFLNAVVYIQHVSVLPLRVTAIGHSPTVYATLLSLNALVVILLELPLTRYVQRLPARLAVAVGIGLVGVGMNLYVAGTAIGLLVAATLVWTLGEIIGTPMASAYPGWVAPPGLRARYIAAAAMPQQIGYAAGPVIGVAVWAAWPAGVWWLSGAVTAVAVAATLVGMRAVDPRVAQAGHGPDEARAEETATGGEAAPAGEATPAGDATPAPIQDGG